MRWFINSTKETAEISDVVPVQTQIDGINECIDIMLKNSRFELNRIHDGMHDKGIQINNILKHQGNQDERIENLENKLQYALHKIEELTGKFKALENQSVQKQSSSDEKGKRKRIVNSYADEKYANVFKIAMGYWATGMKQEKIADKLNAMNFKTPTGKSFHQGNVSDLLANRVQKQRFMAGKDKKAFL